MDTKTLKRKCNMKFHEIINAYDNEEIERDEALKGMKNNAREFRSMLRGLIEYDLITTEQYIVLNDWLKEAHELYEERL